jgi:hypothetical protein
MNMASKASEKVSEISQTKSAVLKKFSRENLTFALVFAALLLEIIIGLVFPGLDSTSKYMVVGIAIVMTWLIYIQLELISVKEFIKEKMP